MAVEFIWSVWATDTALLQWQNRQRSSGARVVFPRTTALRVAAISWAPIAILAFDTRAVVAQVMGGVMGG